MTISNVAVDDAILAETINALIDNVNGSPYRAVFTASGNWTIPAGVQKFKVTLAGGGGAGGTTTSAGSGEGEFTVNPGGPGGTAPMISAIFNAGSVGTSIQVTVGVGGAFGGTGNGSQSSFNGLISSGGSRGGTGGGNGANGNITFPPGFPSVIHSNNLYVAGFSGPIPMGYGSGGTADSNGYPGVVIIEW